MLNLSFQPRRSQGFTLVELMVVIVILGLLAAIAIPRFSLSSYKAKEKEADLILSQVYRMQTAYVSRFGGPADTEENLAEVGFAPPRSMKHYDWTGTVELPLCLDATTGARDRGVNAAGEIGYC